MAAKKSFDEDEEEGESGNDEEDDEEGSSQAVKKRNLGAGKAKPEKGKKLPKKPTEFKKGKWNPHVELVD